MCVQPICQGFGQTFRPSAIFTGRPQAEEKQTGKAQSKSQHEESSKHLLMADAPLACVAPRA
jgi:hypothetical protein